MICAECHFTDGKCYPSDLYKVRCTLTDSFYPKSDTCACDEYRKLLDKAQHKIKELLSEPLLVSTIDKADVEFFDDVDEQHRRSLMKYNMTNLDIAAKLVELCTTAEYALKCNNKVLPEYHYRAVAAACMALGKTEDIQV